MPIIWFFIFYKKKIWFHAIVSFLLASVTYGLSLLIYPFFVKSILQKEYLKRGWEIVEKLDENEGSIFCFFVRNHKY